MLGATAYLLNPGRKVRRRRGKARRRRKNARGWYKKRAKGSIKRKVGKGRRRRTVYTRPKRKTRRKSKRARRRRNPQEASYSYGRKPNMRRRRKRRKTSHRRRNPAGGGGLIATIPQIIPFKAPLPGILGDVVNGVIQGVGAGGVVFSGYLISGALVNAVYSKEAAEASDSAFVKNWARPILFGVSAGLIGGLTAMIAPKGKKATFALLGAAGPGLRAFGGVIKAIMDRPDEAGFVQDIYDGATGLSDYLQVGDLYEAGMGDEDDEGMDDLYEAGMGWEEEGGDMEDYLQVDGVGQDEEVVGI